MAEGNVKNNNKLPRHFVTFVEIFFAVVLGASIVDPEIRTLLFPPASASLSFWALITVYFTAITSWTGWHKSTIKYPYSDSRLGEVRSVVDAIIVATYAALLFFGSRVGGGADKYLSGYLWGFVIVFALYYFVGKVRCADYHTPQASKPHLIVRHGDCAAYCSQYLYCIIPHIVSVSRSIIVVICSLTTCNHDKLPMVQRVA